MWDPSERWVYEYKRDSVDGNRRNVSPNGVKVQRNLQQLDQLELNVGDGHNVWVEREGEQTKR